MNEMINLPNISPGKLGKEIRLELLVHGFFVFTSETNERLAERSKIENSFGKSRVKTNKSGDNLSSYLTLIDASLFGSGYRRVGLLGST